MTDVAPATDPAPTDIAPVPDPAPAPAPAPDATVVDVAPELTADQAPVDTAPVAAPADTATPVILNHTPPQPPKPRITNADWQTQRAAGRYQPGPTDAVTVVCVDCGSLVHIAFTWRHDIFHDGPTTP